MSSARALKGLVCSGISHRRRIAIAVRVVAALRVAVQLPDVLAQASGSQRLYHDTYVIVAYLLDAEQEVQLDVAAVSQRRHRA